MTEHDSPAANEFPRRVKVADLGPEETEIRIEADAKERAALAARLGLVSLDRLEADIRLRPEALGAVTLSARYRADLVQSCVVSLAPVPVTLEEAFQRDYAPLPGGREAPEEEELGEEDPPDPIIDGHIDLGEAVAEQLALDLDPFPRAPDAVFEGFDTDPDAAAGHPFAALARLKDRGGRD